MGRSYFGMVPSLNEAVRSRKIVLEKMVENDAGVSISFKTIHFQIKASLKDEGTPSGKATLQYSFLSLI